MTVELTPSVAARLLDRGPVAAVERFANGTTHGAARIRFEDAALGGVVLKTMPPADAWMASKEAYALRLLAEHGISQVPRVLAVQTEVEELAGGAFIALELLPGRSLTLATPELNEDESREIYRQIGAISRRVHDIRMDGFGYVVADLIVDAMPDNSSHMHRVFERHFREYRERQGDPGVADRAEAIVAADADAFAELDCARLIHGDIHDSNILVDRDESGRWLVTGLVDPANMCAADPLIDLVRTESFCIRGEKNRLAGLLEGYGVDEDEWTMAWAKRLHLYRLSLTFEMRNWFAFIGNIEPLEDLERDLRNLCYSIT